MSGSISRPTLDEIETLLRPDVGTSASAVSYGMTVVEGTDTGANFVLEGSRPFRAFLGTSPACELRLTDREVSRRHAAFEVAGKRLRITDLGSTNGTYVDGVSIVEAYLRGGEIVRVGSSALRVDPVGATRIPVIPLRVAFGNVIGASLEMRKIYPLCEKLAASDVVVVIEGETGTGKEALAEALHSQGPRADGPFVVFDCTAVPRTLMEAELFGHEKGAYTGAAGLRRGLFEQAEGGTLLIDEIGDLDLGMQPKLLRAIERREIRRLGGTRPIQANVRLMVATRRNLDQEVQAGRFRDDLFHRLAVARIELPPLRQRRADIGVLGRHFWTDLGGPAEGPPAELLARWEDQDWPGNVRELRNAVARHLALGELADPGVFISSPELAPVGLPAAPAEPVYEDMPEFQLPLPVARERVVENFERQYIERLLARHGGNIAHAAAAAGISQRYFRLLRARKGP
jgi:two-component system, NtrC family, response regulator HydG